MFRDKCGCLDMYFDGKAVRVKGHGNLSPIQRGIEMRRMGKSVPLEEDFFWNKTRAGYKNTQSLLAANSSILHQVKLKQKLGKDQDLIFMSLLKKISHLNVHPRQPMHCV